MPLHPALQQLIATKLANSTTPQWTLPLDEVRRTFEDIWQPAITGPILELPGILDHTIVSESRSIPIRIYTPAGPSPRPVILYFHGGGFVKGSLKACDAFCRRLTVTTECLVISVGYRLAPEHPFPAALNDAYDATVWAAGHAQEFGGDPNRLIVSGESAGGNLAAVVSLLARDRPGPRLLVTVLLQPVVDFTLSLPSIGMAGDQCLVPREDLEWYYRMYYGTRQELKDPLVSPIFADSLDGLPPTVILAAEYDTLRDEAATYAQRLRDAGNDVRYTCYPSMIHGFLQMGGLVEEAQLAVDDIQRAIRDMGT